MEAGALPAPCSDVRLLGAEDEAPDDIFQLAASYGLNISQNKAVCDLLSSLARCWAARAAMLMVTEAERSVEWRMRLGTLCVQVR